MTQWLQENNLVALNTMYRRLPQKRVTYRTPKGAKKQLDYILTDRKHYCWSKDAEANDTIDMGSDHRCVMAKFEIPDAKRKPRRNKAPSTDLGNVTSEDEHELKYNDLEQEVKDAEPEKTQMKAAEAKASTTAEAQAVATAAAAASSAAADGKSITKSYAVAAEATEAPEAQETKKEDNEILVLIQERKTTAKHDKERIRDISKKIKNCIRDNKRRTRQEKIQKILKKLKGTRNISSIKPVKKRILIPKDKNKEGETIKTRQGIANVFAKFYEDLYEGEESDTVKGMASRTEEDKRIHDQHVPIPEFTKNEIQYAIDRLKKGKAKDSSGVRAEQLKNCSDEKREKIRTIFHEITRQEDFTPKCWRKIRIQVIYKKGDREDAGDYRPICSLLILYKLFATILNARLAPSLHKIQPPD